MQQRFVMAQKGLDFTECREIGCNSLVGDGPHTGPIVRCVKCRQVLANPFDARGDSADFDAFVEAELAADH